MADYSSEEETETLDLTTSDIPSLIRRILTQINPTHQPVTEAAPVLHLPEEEAPRGQFSPSGYPISDFSTDEYSVSQFATAEYPFPQVPKPEATVSKPPTTEDSVSPLTTSKATFTDLTFRADSFFQLTALEATFSDPIADSVSQPTAPEATFSDLTETGDSASQLTTLEAPVPNLEADESLFCRPATPVKDFSRKPAASTIKSSAASGSKPLIEKDEDYPCHICGERYIFENLLRFHLINDHAQPIASTSAFNPTTVSEPLKTFGKQPEVDESRICIFCLKKLPSDRDLNDHIRDVHVAKKYLYGKVCPKKSDPKAALTNHTISHHNVAMATQIAKERRFPCEVCGCKFTSSYNLESHFRVVHALTCFACKKSFVRNERLEKHRKKCMSKSKIEARRRFTCDICGKTFTSRYHLHHHVQSHPQDRRFTCPVCARSFSSQLHLLLHQKCHPKGRP